MYPAVLADAQWAPIEPPASAQNEGRGRPHQRDVRRFVAIFLSY
jgi:hypothetical protein